MVLIVKLDVYVLHFILQYSEFIDVIQLMATCKSVYMKIKGYDNYWGNVVENLTASDLLESFDFTTGTDTPYEVFRSLYHEKYDFFQRLQLISDKKMLLRDALTPLRFVTFITDKMAVEFLKIQQCPSSSPFSHKVLAKALIYHQTEQQILAWRKLLIK